MSLLFIEYEKDIETAKSSIEFISSWDAIGRINDKELDCITGTETHTLVTYLKNNYISFKIDQNIIRGSVVLYSVGRFEMYVKEIVTDVCIRFVKKAGMFSKLPKNLRNNLIIHTGMVIQNPRKYGHGDRGVESFISILSNNINNIMPFEKINTECITITDVNMRPDVINELFVRVGAEKVIEKISSQASILALFQTDQYEKAASDLRTKLNNLMDLRNSIAHPSPSFTWPTKDEIIDYIEFIRLLGKAMDDVSDIYVSALCN